MRKLLFLPLFTVLTISLPAQLRLHVSLANNSGADSVVATATLFTLPDSAVASRKAIVQSASFVINENTAYLLRITGSGRKEVLKKIQVANKDITINIALQNDNTNLQNVTIVSRKSLMRQDGDKTIVDAEPIAQSSTNSYEVIERVPGAVMIDGNVYLNSATPAVIQINGREMKLSAEDLTALLKSLPANSVARIEVLRTPSAKYDAESSGGIVNIVLKKGIKLGTNGTINAEYSQGVYPTFSGGFSVNSNTRLKKSLSYQYTKQQSFEELNNNRIVSGILKQNTFTKYSAVRNFVSAGLDYEFNKKLSIGYAARLSFNNNNNQSENSIDIFPFTGTQPYFKTNSPAQNKTNYFLFNNEIDFLFKLDSAGSEWKNEVNLTWNNSQFNQRYQNYILIPTGRNTTIGDGNTEGKRNNLSYQTDLTLKLKKNISIETGGKFSLHRFTNDAAYTVDSTGTMITDIARTSKYKFSENVNAFYLLVSKSFGGFTIKPGFRIENTNITGHPIVPTDTTFAIRRTDFFPNLYIRQRLFKVFGMEISANGILRKSIVRPGYSALNPAPVYIDPFYYSVGNPGLRPQFTTTYEFNITASEYPVFSLGVNNMKDMFTSVTYQDSASKIVYATSDNLGSNKELYARAIVGIPPGKKYFFYAGAQHNTNHYTGYYNKQPLDYTYSSWMFFMFQSFKPVKSTSLTLFGVYRLRSMWNFYEVGPFGFLNFSINQSVMKGKGNIVLAASDIFRTRKFDFELKQGGINATGLRLEDSRKLTLKFIYNFGIKPKQETKKELFQQPEM